MISISLRCYIKTNQRFYDILLLLHCYKVWNETKTVRTLSPLTHSIFLLATFEWHPFKLLLSYTNRCFVSRAPHATHFYLKSFVYNNFFSAQKWNGDKYSLLRQSGKTGAINKLAVVVALETMLTRDHIRPYAHM